jgi:hypothetical protein
LNSTTKDKSLSCPREACSSRSNVAMDEHPTYTSPPPQRRLDKTPSFAAPTMSRLTNANPTSPPAAKPPPQRATFAGCFSGPYASVAGIQAQPPPEKTFMRASETYGGRSTMPQRLPPLKPAAPPMAIDPSVCCGSGGQRGRPSSALRVCVWMRGRR